MSTTEPPPPPPGDVDADPPSWWQRILRDPQRARLDEELQISKLRLQNLRAGLTGAGADEYARAERVSQALLAAQGHLDRLDVDGGYAHLHLARELEFGLLPQIELNARIVELRSEAEAGKYNRWRKAAILSILDDAAKSSDLPEQRAMAAQAARVAMASSSNGYRKLTILRRHQTILLLIAFVLLAAATVITVANTGDFGEITQGWVAVVSVLLGALGGVTSALQRSTRLPAGTIPERLTSYVVSLSRPLLGAAAGLVAYLGQRVIIDNDGAAKVGAVLVASFAAGFAERLLPVNSQETATGTPPAEDAATPA